MSSPSYTHPDVLTPIYSPQYTHSDGLIPLYAPQYAHPPVPPPLLCLPGRTLTPFSPAAARLATRVTPRHVGRRASRWAPHSRWLSASTHHAPQWHRAAPSPCGARPAVTPPSITTGREKMGDPSPKVPRAGDKVLGGSGRGGTMVSPRWGDWTWGVTHVFPPQARSCTSPASSPLKPVSTSAPAATYGTATPAALRSLSLVGHCHRGGGDTHTEWGGERDSALPSWCRDPRQTHHRHRGGEAGAAGEAWGRCHLRLHCQEQGEPRGHGTVGGMQAPLGAHGGVQGIRTPLDAHLVTQDT